MRNVSILVISDIHLGHRSNDPFKMVSSLRKYLIDSGVLEKIDLMVIAGDLFDRLLTLDYPALAEFDWFFALLLTECSQKNCKLRVLEGTPSHDRGQSSRIETILSLIKHQPDFKYVKDLYLEYFDTWDMSCLYIPDEYKPKTEDTLDEVKALLKSRNLSQVDVAFMHGQFGYQIPGAISGIPIHDQAEYEKLVKGRIFIGHVHTHSQCGKIVAQGSFDRLKHGEEEPKGFVIAKYNEKKDRWFIDFIENKEARKYLSVDISNMGLNEVYQYLAEYLKTIPANSAIRLQAGSNHPLWPSFQQLNLKWPSISFTKQVKAEEKDQKSALFDELSFYEKVEITNKNIKELLMKRIAHYQLSQEEISFIESCINEAL